MLTPAALVIVLKPIWKVVPGPTAAIDSSPGLARAASSRSLKVL